MKKKILIYNWIPFDETEGKGGGVTVYTKNLIRYLIEQTEAEVYFLSSGRAYDRRRKGIFIEKTSNIFGKRCKSFQVVNSPVLSSAHLSFPHPEDMLEDRMLKGIIRQFLIKCGTFDVIHFQNLEGLSLSVLELKEEFPQTRFIYSLHNYYLFCPQVMLWKDDRENCRETRCGDTCIGCMPREVHKKKVIFNQQIAYDLAKGRKISSVRKKVQQFNEKAWKEYDSCRGELLPGTKRKLAKNFQVFRERNVWYVNRYMDAVLAVSKRVGEIAERNGIDGRKIRVCYIGTEAAQFQKSCVQYPYDGSIFSLCYLGYMRRMKGFYFLLDALEHMPESLAGKLGVKLAVSVTDRAMMDRIKCLEKRFAKVVYYPGYTHDQLPQILEGVQLGIVPPLWEDNLPQVAIEMKAHGISVLSSNLGGTRELTCSEEFVFKAGDEKDFIEKIRYFVENPHRLDRYWDQAPRLVTMEEHVKELEEFYGGTDQHHCSGLQCGTVSSEMFG